MTIRTAAIQHPPHGNASFILLYLSKPLSSMLLHSPPRSTMLLYNPRRTKNDCGILRYYIVTYIGVIQNIVNPTTLLRMCPCRISVGSKNRDRVCKACVYIMCYTMCAVHQCCSEVWLQDNCIII